MNTATNDTTPRRRHHGPPLKHVASDHPLRDASPAERGGLAILLHADGLTWRQIASRLGFASAGAAHNCAMRRALQIAPPTPEQQDAARRQLLAQLDEMYDQFVVPLLNSADETKRSIGIEQARQILMRSARLLGVPESQTPLAARLPRWLEVRP